MLSNDLLGITYHLEEHNSLNASQIEKLVIRLENCIDQAKQLERLIIPNAATLNPNDLSEKVVPLHVVRRPQPSTDVDNDGDIA